MKIWWGCGYLATNLRPFPVTKKSEKNSEYSQKIALSDDIKFGENNF